jgi:hypothetical protein
MEEDDRWGLHLEYLKLAIGLSTAVIAASAAIYSEDTKIPTDDSRYLLLVGVIAFALVLIASILGLGKLSDYIAYFPGGTTPAEVAQHKKKAWWAVFWMNTSFGLLIVSAVLVGGFFVVRTWNAGGPAFERAIAVGKRSLNLDLSKNESATLKSIELQGDKYVMVFQIAPSNAMATAITDAAGTKLQSLKKP